MWPDALGAASVVLAIAILYFARDTFIPLALALTLALIFSQPVAWLQRRGIPRTLAALLVMAFSLVLITGISYVIFNQMVLVVNELPTYRATISSKIKALKKPQGGSLGRAAENVKELGKEIANARQTANMPTPATRQQTPVQVQMVEAPQDILTYLRDMIQPIVAPLTMLLIVLVFTIFLLVEETDLRNRLLRLAGVSHLNVMTQALEDATRRVSRYLLLQFMVNVGFGVLCGLGLFAIGVPYAVLWGSVAALFRIVPYLGSIASAVLPLLLCLAVFDGWYQPALVLLLFATVELVTANILEPWLYGTHTGISSIALLLTTIFWATLWGPAGLILSTPLTVCVVVLGRHIKQLSFLHILLGDEPVLPAGAQLYQRLLAMDDHDARTLAEEFKRDQSLLYLYDQVILPAVTMAEQDRHKGNLAPEREEFFFIGIRELLADHSDSETGPLDIDAGRVLCIPAHDEADELAASMLAQLLERGRRASIAFPLGVASFEMLDLVKPEGNDLFCVSSVPPLGFTHASNLSRQLRTRFPGTRIVIGVWGFNGDKKVVAARFKPSLADHCVTSFAEALEYLCPAEASVEVKEGDVGVGPS